MIVKDLMIPISEYTTVPTTATLGEVAQLLSESSHRDVVVVNENGDMEGILTMSDILMALEPNYKKLSRKELNSATLSNSFVSDIFKEFNLWGTTLSTLCQNGCDLGVTEAMHVPEKSETLNENDRLENAIHRYIAGIRQPLVVRSNGTVTGVLRLTDVFEEVTRRMITCTCEADEDI